MLDGAYYTNWYSNLGIGNTPKPGTTGGTTPKKTVDWNKVNSIIDSLLKQGQSVANIIATLKGQGIPIEGGTPAELSAYAQNEADKQRKEEITSIALWVGGGVALLVILAMILKKP